MEEERSQPTRQKRWELRRQEKEAFQKSQKRKRILKKYITWTASIAVAGAVIYGLIFVANQPKIERPGQAIPIQGRNHISENAPTPTYNSNPPTSGPHASPVQGGFYDSEIRDINAVHNLEHGFVWITYKDINNEILARLKEIGQQFSGSVIVSKREANDSPIALASWGRLEKIDTSAFDEKLIINFILKNRNRSPERLAR